MGRKATQYTALGVLLVTLGAVLWYQFARGASAGTPAAVAAQSARTPAEAQRVQAMSVVPDVKVDDLKAKPAARVEVGRNLFRVQPKPVPQPVLSPAARAAAAAAAAIPPPPPPPPPITLKLIGLVDAPGGAGKIAVLSDGRDVYYGREGEIIDGRYRIVRIGAESVDMSYLDGRGARTIPLSVA